MQDNQSHESDIEWFLSYHNHLKQREAHWLKMMALKKRIWLKIRFKLTLRFRKNKLAMKNRLRLGSRYGPGSPHSN